MVEKPSKIPAQPPEGTPPNNTSKPPKDFPKEPTKPLLGMNLTEKEIKQVYANMSNMIIQDIKRQLAREKKALSNLRKSIDGEPLEP